MESQQLLTVSQAADFLGISERAVFRMKDAGSLAYVKLGRSLRFNKDDLNALIQTSTKKASPRHAQQRGG